MIKARYFVIHAISGVTFVIGGIASIVNFILYLVKDTPFNWLWVVLALAGALIAVVNLLLAAVDVKRIF